MKTEKVIEILDLLLTQDVSVKHIQSFESAGISQAKGLVVTMADGSEFQIEVSQTKEETPKFRAVLDYMDGSTFAGDPMSLGEAQDLLVGLSNKPKAWYRASIARC